MLRRLLLQGALAGLLVAETGASTVHAQSASERQQASVAPIKQAIIDTTGYHAAAVELAATTPRFVVTVVNSSLNGASGKVRENEAGRIVAAITRTIAGNAKFRSIQAIRIDYVSRDPDGSHARTVDAIDFRKTPQGAFEHHIT